MPSIYDDEVRDSEKRATGEAPSSTGDRFGLSSYNPQQDADKAESTEGGRHIRGADQGLINQLRQKEALPGGAPGVPNLANPGFSLGGVGGAALKILARSLLGSNKRKAATLGASSSLMAVLGLMWIFNFSAGPLTFLQIGKLLDHHFAIGSHQDDKVVGKMLFEQIFKPPEDVKNPIGDNRLSYLGYLMKNRTLNQLKARGITPRLKSDGFSFDGFEIDPTNAKSPYYDDILSKGSYDDFRTIDALSKAIDPDGKLKLKITASDGKIFVQGNETLFSNTGIKAMSDVLSSGDHPVLDPVWDFIRVRNLSRWNIAGNFHWLSKLNAKVTSAKDAWMKENIYDPIKKGLGGNTSDGLEVQTTDSNGKPVDGPIEGEGAISEASAKGFLSDPKGFADVAGGVAVAAALICLLKTINEAVGIIRWAQVIRPMMTMSAVPMSISSQMQAGQDIDNTEVSDVANNTLNSYDKNGNVTSTWYDAASIRATAGDSGGTDMNQGVKDMLSNSDIPWLDWTKSGAVQTLCSAPAQIALVGISLALMLVPGVDIVNAAIGAVAGSVILGGGSYLLQQFLPSLLAGDGINVQASGAEWGNDIDYGARYQANQNMLAKGGTAVSAQDESQLTAEANTLDRQQFHNESLFARIFDPTDYRSVVGNMMDNFGVYNMQGLVAKVGNIPNILGTLFSLPASLVSASAHAASPYKYPFPMVGFTDDEIDSSISNQPFENADAVSTILDNEESSGDHTYIDKALNCFGVAITKGDHGWQAVPTTAAGTDNQDHTFGPDPYDDANYGKYNCGDKGDTDWLRIRIWILDLSDMEGYSCSLGDVTSCENSGFSTASSNGAQGGNIKFFSQNDPRWADKVMWNGSTIGSEGCVLAAESMAISTLTGKDVTPVDINALVSPDHSLIADPYEHYGLHSNGGFNLPATSENLQKVVDAVKSGAIVVIYADYDSMQPFWGTSGHAEVIRGISQDGKSLFVYDPWEVPDSSNPYVPDPKYPNDPDQHSAKAWPIDNFLSSNIKLTSSDPSKAGMEFAIVTR